MDLNAFLAAAGFVVSSVLNHLDDPPFIDGDWATAEFVIPENIGVNTTVLVDTLAIESDAHCELPSIVSVEQDASGTLSIKSVSGAGCQVEVPVNPAVSTKEQRSRFQ